MTDEVAAQEGSVAGLARALQRRFGGAARLENVVVPSLGGSNRTIVFDLVDGSSRRRMVSRQATYDGEENPFLPCAEQYAVMRVAFANGFPVPEPILLFDEADRLGEGFITAFVAGETMPKRIIAGKQFADVRPKLAGKAGELLALLHGIDASGLGALAATPDSIDPVAAQRRRYDLYDEPHPAIELGFRWLEVNRVERRAPVLLHGDFRNGNLMIGSTGIVAVLDWECAHLGDAAEDLGWLCTRSWRFGENELRVGGFGELADLLDAYRAAGGRRVVAEEVRYWEIFGLVRWAVINMMQANGHLHGGRRDVTFAACGRNASLIEHDLLMTLRGSYR